MMIVFVSYRLDVVLSGNVKYFQNIITKLFKKKPLLDNVKGNESSHVAMQQKRDKRASDDKHGQRIREALSYL